MLVSDRLNFCYVCGQPELVDRHYCAWPAQTSTDGLRNAQFKIVRIDVVSTWQHVDENWFGSHKRSHIGCRGPGETGNKNQIIGADSQCQVANVERGGSRSDGDAISGFMQFSDRLFKGLDFR